MKKTTYTEEQIAAPAGERGISGWGGDPEDGELKPFYQWKKQYGEMGIDAIRRLKQPEEENRKLKQSVADRSLDKLMVQDVLSKKL